MNEAILSMIAPYSCQTPEEYANALKEIIQECVLLALWRCRFFEHAAFYGGTSLRILYGLNRFSEDLDFSLLKADPLFKLESYYKGIETELCPFGFEMEITGIRKSFETPVQSAFVKANTKINFMRIGVPLSIQRRCHLEETLKIKFEIDTDPPLGFNTEERPLLNPIPFMVRSYTLPDLFAGKIHAILYRNWKSRIKGRDWYDLLWYLARKTPVHLAHLQARMEQSEGVTRPTPLTLAELKQLLMTKISIIDLEQAKSDVLPFVKDPRAVDGWSHQLFTTAIDLLSER